MGPAIHPERPPLLKIADVLVNRHDLLRLGMPFLPDAHVQRPAQDIRRRMRPALMLGDREARGVPCLGKGAGAVVDRQAQVVAKRRPRNPLGLVLVKEAVPTARQIRLSPARHGWRTS